ncbi:TRAP-type C4-dicarboxylate transport system, large permease component [uncultured Candidatus Thioglobus sp.]|nr:TRAP-type C4-dicarboxylate transport system, large permease component [uncultured Candidatus Thioglobus sp.]
MSIFLLLLAIIILMMIGVPVAIALGLSSITFALIYSDASFASFAQTLFSAFDGHYTLLAIPFFVLASSYMSTGGVAKRIIRFSIALVGSFRGGLAMASVCACMMFAALSGSSPATVVAIGSLAIAAMIKAGYTKEFATGVICNAGTLGILIPPSIVMVVYAAATEVSVGRMFLGGVIPGLVIGFMLIIAIYFLARIKNIPALPFAGFGEILASAYDAFWGLLLIIIILGGIYGGIFTPTEAAAVAAVYAFIITNFIYRDIGPFSKKNDKTNLLLKIISVFWHKDNKETLYQAGKLSIMLLFIVANALLLKHILTEERAPQMITEFIINTGFGVVGFLLLVNVVLLIGGQFMEPSGLLIIVAPLVFPIAVELGIDPIHLGIMMVVNMEIGLVTPPVGLNLFVSSAVSKMPIFDVIKAATPWLGILFLFLILITYVPIISTWLPTTLMGPELVY